MNSSAGPQTASITVSFATWSWAMYVVEFLPASGSSPPSPPPLGTVLWTNAGDGSGFASIVPAVPSATGVADVFGIQNDGTVAAITSSGTTVWSVNIAQSGGAINVGTLNTSQATAVVQPDFQGGLGVWNVSLNTITKYDGLTGQPYPAYAPGSSTIIDRMAVNTDGTIFVLQQSPPNFDYSLVGINPITATQTFSVPMPVPGPGTAYPHAVVGPSPIVAGDGYAYVSYETRTFSSSDGTITDHLALLRANSAGASDNIPIQDFVETPLGTDNNPQGGGTIITNADQGVLLTWDTLKEGNGMAMTNGTSVSVVSGPTVPGDLGSGIIPILQREDGSFVGTFTDVNLQTDMVAFDAGGNVLWTVANETPQITTAGGGVLGRSGTTYDPNGNATGQVGNTQTQSWTGLQYTSGGSISQVFLSPVPPDIASFWSQAGGNPAGSGTAGTVCACLVQGDAAAGSPDFAPIVTHAAGSHRADVPNTPAGANFLILEGDPGINTVECPTDSTHCHDTGNSWPAVGSTQATSLSSQGYSAVQARVSSVQDFQAQLTGHGTLAGGVIYIGHGGSVGSPGVWDGALFPGQAGGPSTNITRSNVATLSGTNLSNTATVTLYTCEGAYGGYYWSIASQLAMRLRRYVFAWTVSMILSKDPNATRPNGLPIATPPLYLLPYGGAPMKCFSPSGFPVTCPSAQPPFHPYFPN